MKRGFLLMNTGSPDAPTETALHSYLGEFLMDPYVIDLPKPLRYLLVKGLILPRRPAESAKAYASIWTDKGSPLVHYCSQLTHALQSKYNEPIELGMAYGTPSFKNALEKLLSAGAEEICLLPMFPQYAMSTVGSCLAGVKKALKGRAPLRIVPPFYKEPTYIQPLANALKGTEEHILFSYHGLPLRHLKKTDPTGHHCMSSAECCHEASIAHDTCYRYQCLSTTREIVEAASIKEGQYSVSFQSRLGRDKWMEPYTEEMLRTLPLNGKKNLVVVCPAFFCDCLETLEEIEIRGRELFMEAGGESFRVIPCLNDSEAGINCLNILMTNAANWPLV
ncbi:MAG TPA: ferrochelatase [Pontiella sp.]